MSRAGKKHGGGDRVDVGTSTSGGRGVAGGVGIENAMLHLGERRVETLYGEFDVHFFRDLVHDRTAMAITAGDLGSSAPLLCRVHSSCLTSECLMGCDCDCVEQLESALEQIAEVGRGVVFYLMQEGRGAGLSAKARDRMIVQASENRVTTFEAYAAMGLPSDLRRYDSVGPLARLLGVRGALRLLTNNPEKAAAVAAALVDEKLEVWGTEPLHAPSSPFNSDYLRAKEASGHELVPPMIGAGALPPERVRVFEPVALASDPNRVVTASYFLPIALPTPMGAGLEVDWFRLSVVFDSETARESILLAMGEGEDPAQLAMPEADHTRTLSLLDRLPRPPGTERRALVAALVEIRDRGEGRVAVICDESAPTFARPRSDGGR